MKADDTEQDAVTGRHEAAEATDLPPQPGSHKGAHRASTRAGSEVLDLVVEFVKMSRTTAILLIAFVLTLALYMLVRQDPVVAFNSPPRSDSTQSDTTGTDTSGTDVSGTDVPTSTDQPTGTTDPSETPTSTDTSGTEIAPSAGQRGTGPDEGQVDGQPQQSPQLPQGSAGQAPQSSPQPQQFEQTQVPVS